MAIQRKTTRFRIEGTLQSCRLFTLVKAFDEQEMQPVLVRRFAANLFSDDESWQRFRQNLKELSALDISGLLPVREIGGQTRQPWLVIGDTDGTTLRDRLTSAPPARLLDWLGSVANTLTELHSLGHVHGRVRPEAVFFNIDKQPCLEEIASVNALCAWDAQHHDLPSEFVGDVFVPGYLAPEIRAGGPVTSQTDQYSLAVVLLECLTGQPLNAINLGVLPNARRRFIETIQPVLSRALADDPQQRFPTCRDFLATVWQAHQVPKRRQQQQIVMLIAGLILLLFGAYFGKSELDRHRTIQEQARRSELEKHEAAVRELEASLYREIASEYEDALPKSELKAPAIRPDFLVLFHASKETKFVESLLWQQDPTSKLPTLLSEGPSPVVTLEITSDSQQKITNPGTNGPIVENDERTVFLFADDGGKSNKAPKVILLRKPALNLHYKVTIAIDASKFRREQEAKVTIAILDGAGKELDKQSAVLAKDKSSLEFNSFVGSNELDALTPGDSLRVQAWLTEEATENRPWQKSNPIRIGELVKQSKIVTINVAELKKANYAIETNFKAKAGDKLRVSAAGQIRLGSDKAYQEFLFKKTGEQFGPNGLENINKPALKQIKDKGFIFLSGNDNYQYGALLIKIGQGAWQIPSYNRLVELPDKGVVALGLNGVCYKKNQPLAGTDIDTWWAGTGDFKVTITLHSLTLPPETSDLAQNSVRSELSY